MSVFAIVGADEQESSEQQELEKNRLTAAIRLKTDPPLQHTVQYCSANEGSCPEEYFLFSVGARKAGARIGTLPGLLLAVTGKFGKPGYRS